MTTIIFLIAKNLNEISVLWQYRIYEEKTTPKSLRECRNQFPFELEKILSSAFDHTVEVLARDSLTCPQFLFAAYVMHGLLL